MEDNLLKSHSVSIDNREKMRLTGVSQVISYDERRIILITAKGGLVVGGSQLKIAKVDTKNGDAEIEGKIIALEYSETPREKGLFRKLFR